tara:strand:+ start:287 stop:583 length:297 start_codon:yes stop_codon:yes gene_type:complete
MPREKKRNPGRNKKKVLKKQEQKGPLEYKGYQIGQEVWVRMDIYGGTEWAFGSIYQFHPDDSIEPSFSLFDKIRKRYAVAPVGNISVSPPKKWMGKVR